VNCSYIIIGVVRFAPRQRSTATIAVLLTAMGCAAPGIPPGPVAPTPLVVQNSQSATAPNTPPRIIALTLSTDRIEVGEEVTITATVVDDETPLDDLTYSWGATSGTVAGTGRIVRWKASPSNPTPLAYKISLNVIEKYAAGEQSLEHRVTAESPAVYVNDSPKEVRALSEEFIRDFANSSLSPQFCVRNFSDSCRGKQSELEDIIDNRRRFKILSHTFSISSATFTGSTQSTVRGRCEFRSTELATGALKIATGTCTLRLTYEDHHWWLCDSSMTDSNLEGLTFPF
jgi:hypothetical protein